jgi:hypothetical protein
MGDVEQFQFGERKVRVIDQDGEPMSDDEQFGAAIKPVGITFGFPITGNRQFVFDGEPRDKWHEYHLYVVEFGDYGIKVGYASNPADRLMAHQRAGRNFGRTATRGWLSSMHVEAQDNETALINFCADLTRTPRLPRCEYSAAPFDLVREYAASLPMTRLTVGDKKAREARSRAGANVFASITLGRPVDISEPLSLSRSPDAYRPGVICAEKTALTSNEIAAIIRNVAVDDGAAARNLFAVATSATCPLATGHEGTCVSWVATLTDKDATTCWLRWDCESSGRDASRTLAWLLNCSAAGVDRCLLHAGHPGKCQPLDDNRGEPGTDR